MPTDLRRQVAVVTGGSRGIGRAIAQALVAEGAQVLVTGLDDAHLAEARHDIEGAGPGAIETLRADVRVRADLERAIAAAVGRFGGLDVLVNNAGIGRFAAVADMAPEDWAAVLETNLTGAYHACHAAIPHLRARGGGFIVNISSLASTGPFAGGAAYCASKAGLNAFSESLMQELRYDNIRVSCVLPGSVATGFSGGDPTRGSEWKVAPEDVATVVIALLKTPARTLPSRVELRPSQPRK